MSEKKKSGLRENIEAIVIAILIAMVIRAFIVEAFKIPTGSMEKTLLVGDHIIVNKFIYGIKMPFTNKTIIPIKQPKQGDVVVFKYPLDPSVDYIKRVIAVAGDTLEIKNKKIYINGQLYNHDPGMFIDSRIAPPNVDPRRDNYGPVTVPENSLFMMGDNRDNSNDSRFWGYVSLDHVKGKALMIYWSWDKTKFGVRWGRIGDIIK